MGELVPSYPQPYRLYNPYTGRPLLSGPNGQPGYGTAQPQADSWVQPDGVRVWFYDTSTPDPNNRVALGLDVSSPNDPGIGYQGAYEAAVRHGASTLPRSASNVVCPQGGGGRVPEGTSQADLFAAIAMAESSAHWSDHNNNSRTGDDSIGLWQINLRAHPQYRAVNLYNIDANAQAASEVSGNWQNACPWSTYSSGAYLQYLGKGSAPVGATAPPPPPPPGHTGVVRQTVDDFVRQLPNPSIFGYHPRDSLQSALDAVANVVDDWIDNLAHDIQGAITFATNLGKSILGQAESLVTGAEHLAETGLTDLAHFTEGLIVGAENVAATGLRDAERFLESLVTDAEHIAAAGLDSLARFTEGLIVDAEHAATAGLDDLAHFTEGLITDAEHIAEAGVREAEHLAEAGIADVEHVAESLAHDAEGAAETLARDLVHEVDSAWRAFVTDVFDPLKNEADRLFHDLAPLGADVLGDLVKLGDWIVAAAHVLFITPLEVAETVADISSDEVLAAVRSAAGL
jgi:Lysozyme like domain